MPGLETVIVLPTGTRRAKPLALTTTAASSWFTNWVAPLTASFALYWPLTTNQWQPGSRIAIVMAAFAAPADAGADADGNAEAMLEPVASTTAAPMVMRRVVVARLPIASSLSVAPVGAVAVLGQSVAAEAVTAPSQGRHRCVTAARRGE